MAWRMRSSPWRSSWSESSNPSWSWDRSGGPADWAAAGWIDAADWDDWSRLTNGPVPWTNSSGQDEQTDVEAHAGQGSAVVEPNGGIPLTDIVPEDINVNEDTTHPYGGIPPTDIVPDPADIIIREDVLGPFGSSAQEGLSPPNPTMQPPILPVGERLQPVAPGKPAAPVILGKPPAPNLPAPKGALPAPKRLANFPMPGPPAPKTKAAVAACHMLGPGIIASQGPPSKAPPHRPKADPQPLPPSSSKAAAKAKPKPPPPPPYRLHLPDIDNVAEIAPPSYAPVNGLGEAVFDVAPQSAVADGGAGGGNFRGVDVHVGSLGTIPEQQAMHDAADMNRPNRVVHFTTGAMMILSEDEAPLTEAFFQGHPTYRFGNIRDHNAALKYLRQVLEPVNILWNEENADRFPSATLYFTTSIDVRMVVHMRGGWRYGFDMSATGCTTYQPASLLAHLTDLSLSYVINGPNGNSGGINNMRFEPRKNSYDHNRSVQQPSGARMRLPRWDFVVYREDGSTISLHPSWQGTTISCVEGYVEAVIPQAGAGCSDGPGTHQAMLRGQSNLKLHFRSTLR